MPVAPVMVSGARDTTNHLAGRQIVDMGRIFHLENDKAALATMVSKLSKKKAHAQRIDWMEDQLNPKSDLVNQANEAAIGTSIVVDNGGYFRAGDLVKVPRTGEVISVTSVATNTLTVVRGAGNTAAALIQNREPLLIMSNAAGQGSTLGTARTTKEVQSTNYMQILRSHFEVTGTEARIGKAGGHYDESDTVTQRRKKALEHARDINLTAYWGEAKLLAGGKGLAGGVVERIPVGNRDSTATLTETALNTALRTMFRYGSSTKTLFCSRQVAGIIDGLLRDRLRMSVGDKVGGNHFTEYQSTHGKIRIVPDHAIEGGAYDKYAVLVDSEGLEYVTLQDTVLLTDRQAPDKDAIVEEYFTEFSFRWGNGDNHGLFNAING